MFKNNNLSLKRSGDAAAAECQQKVPKITVEDQIRVISNVLINPNYDIVSLDEDPSQQGILYNMLSQPQSLNDTEKNAMDEFIRLPPQSERPVQMGEGGKNISMLKHIASQQLPEASGMSNQPDTLNNKIGGVVANILALQEKFKQGVAAEKLLSPDNAACTSLADRQPDIDLDYPQRMVGGMLQNILALQEQFQRGVTAENRILEQMEADIMLQMQKVNKLIEGVNYLQSISEAMNSFNQFK